MTVVLVKAETATNNSLANQIVTVSEAAGSRIVAIRVCVGLEVQIAGRIPVL
jgi:hypothetical protein